METEDYVSNYGYGDSIINIVSKPYFKQIIITVQNRLESILNHPAGKNFGYSYGNTLKSRKSLINMTSYHFLDF